MGDADGVGNAKGRHEIGERGGDRTRDHRIKSPMLYRLSYPFTVEGVDEAWSYERVLYRTAGNGCKSGSRAHGLVERKQVAVRVEG